MYRNGSHKGFTVLEILVIITIIALASTISALHIYSSLNSVSLYGAAKKMLYTARYARLLAVENHQPCTLHIDLDQNSYFLSFLEPGIPVAKQTESADSQIVDNMYVNPTVLPEEVQFQTIQVDDTPTTQNGEILIQFREDGSAQAAIIQLGNQKNVYTIVVNPFTAKAELITAKVEKLPIDTINLDKAEN
jgi:Tfp pilus assembly protein FimT